MVSKSCCKLESPGDLKKKKMWSRASTPIHSVSFDQLFKILMPRLHSVPIKSECMGVQVSRSKRVTAKNCLIPVWTRNPKILDSEPNTIVKWDFGGPSEGESIFCTCFCFVCSVAKLCPTLCDLMDSSTPGFPDLHHLLEFAQIHVHLSQWRYLSILSSAAIFFCL